MSIVSVDSCFCGYDNLLAQSTAQVGDWYFPRYKGVLMPVAPLL